MKCYLIIFLLLFTVVEVSCQDNQTFDRVLFGNEILINEHLDLLKDKKIGIIANQTSMLPGNVHLADTLISLGVNIIALFSPEHGIRGNVSAGIKVESFIDDKTGIPVHSLYGKTKKPTAEMLAGIELLLFDIQDIGVRFYTYNSTLYYAIEAAAENEIPIVILDRPNPLNGELVAGPVLNPDYKSFVGVRMLPVLHGMTTGELAQFFKNELIADGRNPKVQIIAVKGWNRKDNWNELNLEWIPTSPNIPDFETALVYPGICFLEGTNVSEGRGTDQPFLSFGAPFINSEELIRKLESLDNPGIKLSPAEFTPEEIDGKAANPKFEGIVCNGISIKVIDDKNFNPLFFGINVVYSLLKLYPDRFKFNERHFDLLAGTDKLRKDLLLDKTPDEIFSGWKDEIEHFRLKRKKYLLY